MNQDTVIHLLKLITAAQNKKHWRIRNHIARIETLISEYRITAKKMLGTEVSRICNSNANELEKQLKKAMG